MCAHKGLVANYGTGPKKEDTQTSSPCCASFLVPSTSLDFFSITALRGMSVERQDEPVASTSALSEERQIAVRLTTKDLSYAIPSTKFLVPSTWRRFHLSELINKVLENSKRLVLPLSPPLCWGIGRSCPGEMIKNDIRKVFFVPSLRGHSGDAVTLFTF